MTRAADRLIVCGSVGEQEACRPAAGTSSMQQGLEATGLLIEEPADFGDGDGAALSEVASEAAGQLHRPPAARVRSTAAGLADARRSRPSRRARHCSGRRARSTTTAHARAGQAARTRAARWRAATHVHRLMQSLPDIPPARRAEAARRYLARQKEFDDAERTEIAAHSCGLLDDLRFAALFLPGSRAEVSIVGRARRAATVSGQVDRLVVTPDEVLIADYKTNRPAPKSLDEAKTRHADYVTQLALYRAVLRRLYPGRPVRAALLWTETPELMEIPAADLDAALAILTSA